MSVLILVNILLMDIRECEFFSVWEINEGWKGGLEFKNIYCLYKYFE